LMQLLRHRTGIQADQDRFVPIAGTLKGLGGF
jgi:hypothetical protein